MSERSLGFDEKAQRKAKTYFYNGLSVSLCKNAILLVLAMVSIDLRLSVWLENSLRTYFSQQFLVVALFCTIGYAAVWVLSLPFDHYKGYLLERKFDLSTNTTGNWLRNHGISSTLTFLIVLSFVEVVNYFSILSPRTWWLFTWIVSAPFIVLFMYAYPVLIMPLFYKFPKLEDDELLHSLSDLAKRAGIQITGVFEMKISSKTKKETAALEGTGNSRKMLLSDTFLANSSRDEIETVMGHELGHQKYGHFWKKAVVYSIAFLVILFFTHTLFQIFAGLSGLGNISSASSLPLMAIILGLLLAAASPITNTLSRSFEGQCDQYALDLVRKPDAFVSKITHLCNQNLGYAYPHPAIEWVFYSHPSGKNRIAKALRFKEIRDL